MKPYPNCDICDKLLKPNLEVVIMDTPYWLVQVRVNNQTMLGTCLVILKRHAPELDFLTPEEEAAFIEIRNQLIRALRLAFHPLTFNVSSLKNNAFSEDPDNIPSELGHVHWHIKPRYGTKPSTFHNETFTDSDPGHYDKQLTMRVIDIKLASEIATAIKAKL